MIGRPQRLPTRRRHRPRRLDHATHRLLTRVQLLRATGPAVQRKNGGHNALHPVRLPARRQRVKPLLPRPLRGQLLRFLRRPHLGRRLPRIMLDVLAHLRPPSSSWRPSWHARADGPAVVHRAAADAPPSALGKGPRTRAGDQRGPVPQAKPEECPAALEQPHITAPPAGAHRPPACPRRLRTTSGADHHGPRTTLVQVYAGVTPPPSAPTQPPPPGPRGLRTALGFNPRVLLSRDRKRPLPPSRHHHPPPSPRLV
uniref:Putative proline-rich extensin-like protein n=1 Tax=Micrococcus sp. 28 TaxID=161213 RepID=Q8VPN7_9MICC|nr:putative proline-rich extensin-like protein [Micrococcus sp. 28]